MRNCPVAQFAMPYSQSIQKILFLFLLHALPRWSTSCRIDAERLLNRISENRGALMSNTEPSCGNKDYTLLPESYVALLELR